MNDRRQSGSKRVKLTHLPQPQRQSKAQADPDQTETDPGYYTPDGSFVALPARPRTNRQQNTG